MKILWVTPKWTLPAIDGARVASTKLLDNLNTENIELHYLAFSNQEDQCDENEVKDRFNVSKVFNLPRQIPATLLSKLAYYLFYLLKKPFFPLTLNTFHHKNDVEKFHEILLNEKYDKVIFDGLHCSAPLFDSFSNFNFDSKTKIYYRSHNVEFHLWERSAKQTNNPIKKLFFSFQKNLLYKYEMNLIANSEMTFPISLDDEIEFKKINSSFNSTILPIGMEFKNQEFQSKTKTCSHFLFIGRLDWPPNKDGLKWLLENVWPHVDHSKSFLHIVGSGNGDWLESFSELPSCKRYGFVKSIDAVYELADCTLIPIFYGSGTRIKVIESVAKSKPMISTKMGALGSTLIGNQDYISAESASEWIMAINSFDTHNAKSYVESAKVKLIDLYDERKIGKKLTQILE